MDVSELMRMLDRMLPSATSQISFVVTEIPPGDYQLERLLDGALAAARRHGVPLAEVQIDMARYPHMGAFYWHVPVVESGRVGVVRLVFEPRRQDVDLPPPAARIPAEVAAH